MKFTTRLKYYFEFLGSLWRVNWGLLTGMWKLTRLPQPTITVFGGTQLAADSEFADKICAITKKLAGAGFSILTGGGPGVMRAANLGAYETANTHGEPHKHGENGREQRRHMISMGIGLETLPQDPNKYTQDFIVTPYFFTRKWLLVRYAVGFVVGPGGFGTLDELSEVLTLIQTHHMPQTPVVLIGTEYWAPLLQWVNERALRDGLLTKEDAALIHVTDDVDEAFTFIKSQCLGHEECGITAPPTE